MMHNNQDTKGPSIIIMLGIITILMIISSAQSYALGIAPSKRIIDYDANADYTQGLQPNRWELTGRIVNNDAKDMDIMISASGELSGYVTIYEPIIHLDSTDSEKEFRYTLELPQGMTPGTKTINIIASQTGTDTDNVIGLLALTQQLQINIPYSGSYIEGYVSTSSQGKREPVILTLMMTSKGTQSINELSAKLEIKDGQGTTIYSSDKKNYQNIAPGSSLKVEENALIANAGHYHASYIIDYDDKNLELSREFDVGEYNITSMNADVENFRLGTIAKVDISLSVDWNTPIEGAYGEITLKDNNGTIIRKTTTDKIVFTPDTNTMTGYIDTQALESGSYVIGIQIYAAGKIISREYPATITQDSITIAKDPSGIIQEQKTSRWKYILPIILVLAAAILLMIIIKKSRKHKIIKYVYKR